MPIVPAFNPDTGASGGPAPVGPSPSSAPVWLDVPTQIEALAGTSVTASITLNTPTNGTAPYSYRVIPTAQLQNSTLSISGNVLEISNPAALATSATVTGSECYRVIVRDSAGNLGVGALIILVKPNAADTTLLIEHTLDWNQSTEGYLFTARSSPSATATGYQPSGDGFGYPKPVTVADVEGDRWANTPPGGCFLQLYRRTNYPSSGQNQIVFLLLRRKLNMTGNSWVEAQDFLKFDSLNNITPTVPLGTSSTFTTTTENNPVTSLSYKIQSVAYAITAGTAPTAETASYSTGGPLLLSTAATTASTRVITFGLRPASSGVAGVNERYGSLSTAIAGMIRIKCKITLTGDYPYLDIVWGNVLVGSAPSSVGIRIRGRQATSFTIGGQPAVQVWVQVGGTLRVVGWFRRSLFDGSDIGIDIMALGGVASASIYPWDPAWTDFPDYIYEAFSLDVPNVIGPIPIAVSSTITRTNLPYSGGVLPIYTVGAQLDNSNNWGVHFGIAPGGNAAGGTADLEVYAVKYYWKMLNIGDSSW